MATEHGGQKKLVAGYQVIPSGLSARVWIKVIKNAFGDLSEMN